MISASRKVDYAILLMASLPGPDKEDFRSLGDIAHEKHLSSGFLSQIMVSLKKAGLVRAREGIKGGYQLKKRSSDICISEIYEALEGPLQLTTCLSLKRKCACEESCPTRGLWKDLQSLMNQYLQKKYLSDFLK